MLVAQGTDGGLLGFGFVVAEGGRVVEDTGEGQWRRGDLAVRRGISGVVVLTEGVQHDRLLGWWFG